MAQTGFLPVVTMVSRGFAFIDEKRERERGGEGIRRWRMGDERSK